MDEFTKKEAEEFVNKFGDGDIPSIYFNFLGYLSEHWARDDKNLPFWQAFCETVEKKYNLRKPTEEELSMVADLRDRQDGVNTSTKRLWRKYRDVMEGQTPEEVGRSFDQDRNFRDYRNRRDRFEREVENIFWRLRQETVE